MTFTHALSTNNYGPAKFIVSADPANGTHTTIAAALTAASSGDTIFIRQGTYTENLTLKAGVNLSGWPSDGDTFGIRQTSATFNAKIIGKLTMSTAGFVSISNLYLQTNSDNIIATSGSVEAVVIFKNCYLYASNNTMASVASTTGNVTFENCSADLGTTGITYFSVSSGANLVISGGVWANSGASTTASTYSSTGNVTIRYCEFICPITSSGTAGGMTLQSIFMNYAAGNTTMVTHNSTGAQPTIMDSFILSGTASSVSVGAGASIRILNTKIASSNTNAITGAGSVEFSAITFTGTSITNNATTQTTDYNNLGKWISTGQSSFLVTANLQSNVTGDATTYTLLWANEIFDQDNNFSSPTFTAPVTGRYQMNIMIRIADISSTAFTLGALTLVTSNRNYAATCNPGAIRDGNTNCSMAFSQVCDFDASDTASITLQVSGSTKTIDVAAATLTQWSGQLIA